MATVWELITEASSLPDDGINTFWDHLNNLEGTGGTAYPVYYRDIQVAATVPNIQLQTTLPTIEASTADIGLETESTDIIIDNPSIELEVDK